MRGPAYAFRVRPETPGIGGSGEDDHLGMVLIGLLACTMPVGFFAARLAEIDSLDAEAPFFASAVLLCKRQQSQTPDGFFTPTLDLLMSNSAHIRVEEF